MAKAKNKAAKKVAAKSVTRPLTAKQQLEALIGKVEKKHQPLFRSVQGFLRKRFPAANELVYDYSHALVLGYSPNQNGIESVAALSAGADGIRLYLMNGPKLPDPTGLLQGTAKQARYIAVDAPKTVKQPDVAALIEAAENLAKTPFATGSRGGIYIKSSSAGKAAKKAAKKKPAR